MKYVCKICGYVYDPAEHDGVEFADLPDDWTCPMCGQTGNTGNFCPTCGTARPGSGANEHLKQIPGETDRVEVSVLRIDGSSCIRDKKDPYLYESWNAIDRDDATCWQFSAKNLKKNPPWLAMIVEGQTIDEIWIKNGFRAANKKGKPQYPLYARLKEIRVVFSNTENGDMEEMTFTLSDENDGGWEKLDTGRHENVYDVMVYVLSVYKGSSKKNNACLDEIMLVQKGSPADARPVIE